jgi:chorismate synthase
VLEKFGGDSVTETDRNLRGYLDAIPQNLTTERVHAPYA